MSRRNLRVRHPRICGIEIARKSQMLHEESALLFRKSKMMDDGRLRGLAVRKKSAVEIDAFEIDVGPVDLALFDFRAARAGKFHGSLRVIVIPHEEASIRDAEAAQIDHLRKWFWRRF